MIEQIKTYRVECDLGHTSWCLGAIERNAASKSELRQDLRQEGWNFGQGWHPRWDAKKVTTAECPKCLENQNA